MCFRGLSNTREYLLRDQQPRFTLTAQNGLVFANPANWYLTAATANGPVPDSLTGEFIVMANGILQAKTDHSHFIMLRDGDVLAAAPPPVPEPSTWALMLDGMGLMAWHATARRGGRADCGTA